MIEVNSLNEDEKFALLYGIMLGDGCLSKYKPKRANIRFNIVVTCGEADREFFIQVVIPLFKSFTSKNVHIKERPKYHAIEISFCDELLFDKIASFGFSVGKKQDIILHNNLKKNIKFIIAGLLATDGCLTLVNNNGTLYPRIFFTAALPSILKEVFIYLNSIGIKAGFYSTKRKDFSCFGYLRTKPTYVCSSNGLANLDRFAEKIGFAHLKHEEIYINYKNTRKNGCTKN